MKMKNRKMINFKLNGRIYEGEILQTFEKKYLVLYIEKVGTSKGLKSVIYFHNVMKNEKNYTLV